MNYEELYDRFFRDEADIDREQRIHAEDLEKRRETWNKHSPYRREPLYSEVLWEGNPPDRETAKNPLLDIKAAPWEYFKLRLFGAPYKQGMHWFHITSSKGVVRHVPGACLDREKVPNCPYCSIERDLHREDATFVMHQYIACYIKSRIRTDEKVKIVRWATLPGGQRRRVNKKLPVRKIVRFLPHMVKQCVGAGKKVLCPDNGHYIFIRYEGNNFYNTNIGNQYTLTAEEYDLSTWDVRAIVRDRVIKLEPYSSAVRRADRIRRMIMNGSV